MSDEEMHSDEGRAEYYREEVHEERQAPVRKQEMIQDTGPSEAELALQRRKQQITSSNALDEFAADILEQSRRRREALEEEIEELRQRNERRKAERAEEEKVLLARRAEEEARLKAEADERKQKKLEEAAKKKAAHAAKMAEFEKWKQPQARNFVITKKEGGGGLGPSTEQEEEKGEKKSKEQLEAEKRAILGQRIHALEISGFDSGKLAEKARELHAYIYRLESEKYDLEKRFREQQSDMLELAERARSMNKVGKGGFKRVQLSEDQRDPIQEKYAGTSAKIEMYSKYERQKDKRAYGEKRDIFTGAMYGFPAERIQPRRILRWDEDGLPIYEGGAPPPREEPAPQEEVAAEEE